MISGLNTSRQAYIILCYITPNCLSMEEISEGSKVNNIFISLSAEAKLCSYALRIFFSFFKSAVCPYSV